MEYFDLIKLITLTKHIILTNIDANFVCSAILLIFADFNCLSNTKHETDPTAAKN